MAPHFTIFSQCPGSVVEKLRSVFGEVFVDGLTVNTMMLKDRYKGVNGYFFYYNDSELYQNTWSYYDLDFEPPMPYLLLSFDVDKCLTANDEELIQTFVKAIFSDCNDIPEEFFELVPKPVKLQNSAPEKDLTPAQELLPDYSFEYKVDTGRDIAFCQVQKPFTDRPYTLVIRNFDQRGLKCFFSGIFAATSWGVSSHDIAFLHKLWKFLDMEKEYGKLDLEMLLKDHVQRCTEEREMEPEVYRLDYKTVHKNFERSLAKKRRLLE